MFSFFWFRVALKLRVAKVFVVKHRALWDTGAETDVAIHTANKTFSEISRSAVVSLFVILLSQRHTLAVSGFVQVVLVPFGIIVWSRREALACWVHDRLYDGSTDAGCTDTNYLGSRVVKWAA